MDAVASKLLVLKGDGLVRMFQGSYSEVRAGNISGDESNGCTC